MGCLNMNHPNPKSKSVSYGSYYECDILMNLSVKIMKMHHVKVGKQNAGCEHNTDVCVIL